MAVLEQRLDATVDPGVRQDLSALSVEQLQAQISAVAPAAQRLSGFAALASAELTARTGGS